jgi:hypothetical protein
MSLGLRFHGRVIGVDPSDPSHVVYTNRDAVGAWEDVAVTRHADGWVDVRFLAANRQLTITPAGQLESRPAGAIGEWEQFTVSADGTTITRVGVTLPIDGVITPPASALHLEVRGRDFVDAHGQRVSYPGCDAFLAFRQYRDGGAAALEPFLAESAAIGFTVWRVFMQGSQAQNQVMNLSPKEAGYYDDVRPFADLLNAHGIIPLATAYVDNQDVRSGLDHWVQLGQRLRGSSSLLSGFNQWSKNKSDFDPWALPDPGGVIWSRGSDVDDTVTDPRGAPASELHATRTSFDRALMDATASPPFMRSKGAGMVWMTEGNPFGDGNGYTDEQAWQLGRGYSILWALAVFHNRQSQRGEPMHEDTARCGAAWVKGMRL